ncbi:phage tail protein [Klebsiella aerogenes]|uniref:phage tail protein n=1 Tax=Klebsiella aerogenes TaxID=548 RepID=UPI00300C79E7
MSQTVITLAFEQWKAQQGNTGEVVLLDEFVFANVPGLDPAKPIDRNEKLPPAGQIVHRQAVTRKGVVNENAVVHSVVLGADVGDFSFNWIGLINKASGTLAMIVHAPVQQKLKTKEGQQGNVLTRSFLMEYNGAQAETAINTPAETWQIDFTARMAGMDERQRLENTDIYGAAAFFGDGWLVGKSGNQYFVTKGTGYVAGLRAELAANQNITVAAKPVKVWLDVCWTGGFTSAWEVQTKVAVAASLADYEQNGIKHHVFALASIDANGNITDLRPKGSQVERVAVKSVDNLKPDAAGNVDTLRGDSTQAVIAIPTITNSNNAYIKIATIKDCGQNAAYFQISVAGSGSYGSQGQNIEDISVSCRGIANMTSANVDTYIKHVAISNGASSVLRVIAAPTAKAGEFDIYLNATGGWWYGTRMRVEAIAGSGYISGPVIDRKMGANAWTTNKPANSFMVSRFNILSSGDTGTSGTKIPLLSTANTWSEIQTFKKDIKVGATGDTSVISMGDSSQIIRDNGKKGLIITSASGALAGNGAGLYLRPKGSTDSSMELVGNATGWSVDKFTATTFTVNGATSLKGGVTVTNGAIVYGEMNSVMNRTDNYPVGSWVNGGLLRSFIFGRGAYGDTRGAFTNLYIQELVGSYNQAVLNLNGFGNDTSWIFRNDGSFFSPGMIFEAGQRVYSPNNPQPNVVTNVRLSALTWAGKIGNATHDWGGGCVITAVHAWENYAINMEFGLRAIQVLINGQWLSIGSI